MSTYTESYTTDSNRAAVRYEDADGATIALVYIDNAAGKRICRAFRDQVLRDGVRLLDKHTGTVVIGALDEVAPVAA
jgi:hypothetical protein